MMHQQPYRIFTHGAITACYQRGVFSGFPCLILIFDFMVFLNKEVEEICDTARRMLGGQDA